MLHGFFNKKSKTLNKNDDVRIWCVYEFGDEYAIITHASEDIHAYDNSTKFSDFEYIGEIGRCLISRTHEQSSLAILDQDKLSRAFHRAKM